MAINWNPVQTLRAPTFDPSRGLATAADAFQGINNTIDARNRAEADKLYKDTLLAQNKRQQDYVEGAPQRAILEEQRKQKQAADKAQLVTDMANATGYDLTSSLLAPAWEQFKKSPEAQGMTPEQLNNYQQQWIADPNTKRLLSDPSKFKGTLADRLVGTGQFGYDEAQNRTNQAYANEGFTALDPTIMDKLLVKPGSGSSSSGVSGTGASASGSYGLINPQASVKDTQDLVDNFVSSNGLSKGTAPSFMGIRWDLLNRDVTEQDIKKYLSNMAIEHQLTPNAALAAIQERIDLGGTSKLDIGDLTPDQRKELAVAGNRAMAQEQAMYNRKNGIGGNTQNSYAQDLATAQQYNQGILSMGTPRKATVADVLASLRSGLPGQAGPVVNTGANKPNPQGSNTPVPAPNTNTNTDSIMTPPKPTNVDTSIFSKNQAEEKKQLSDALLKRGTSTRYSTRRSNKSNSYEERKQLEELTRLETIAQSPELSTEYKSLKDRLNALKDRSGRAASREKNQIEVKLKNLGF